VLSPAVPGHGDDDLHAVAGRHPTDGGLLCQALRVPGAGQRPDLGAAGGGGGDDDRVLLLLPPRGGRHAGDAGGGDQRAATGGDLDRRGPGGRGAGHHRTGRLSHHRARLGEPRRLPTFSSWPFMITAVLMYTSIGASMFIRIPAAWRRATDPAQRNRGLGAEVASIIFHGSFFLLLVGVLYGKAGGFVGNTAVVEGDSFVEARANYDNLSEG